MPLRLFKLLSHSLDLAIQRQYLIHNQQIMLLLCLAHLVKLLLSLLLRLLCLSNIFA